MKKLKPNNLAWEQLEDSMPNLSLSNFIHLSPQVELLFTIIQLWAPLKSIFGYGYIVDK